MWIFVMGAMSLLAGAAAIMAGAVGHEADAVGCGYWSIVFAMICVFIVAEKLSGHRQ